MIRNLCDKKTILNYDEFVNQSKYLHYTHNKIVGELYITVLTPIYRFYSVYIFHLNAINTLNIHINELMKLKTSANIPHIFFSIL